MHTYNHTYIHTCSDHLGYICGSPALVGTGMTFSVTLKLPRLSKRADIAALVDDAGLKLPHEGVCAYVCVFVCACVCVCVCVCVYVCMCMYGTGR